MKPDRAQRVKEPGVRFQFFLPARVARLVDAERDRRRASGYGGRGKSDYTAIFRDLVEEHLGGHQSAGGVPPRR